MLNEKNKMEISESTQRHKDRRKRRKSSLPQGYVKDKIDELLIRNATQYTLGYLTLTTADFKEQ